MNNKGAADWRADLDALRDLSDLEKQNTHVATGVNGCGVRSPLDGYRL